MNYIDTIFQRLDIQQMCEFLMRGTGLKDISGKSCYDRLEDAQKEMRVFFQNKFPDMNECEKVTTVIYSYAGVCEEVYMEIGMMCGVKLALQLLGKM